MAHALANTPAAPKNAPVSQPPMHRPLQTTPLMDNIPLLQRKAGCACGGGCPRCQDEIDLQPRLKIGKAGDRYEQEADRLADQVMHMPAPEDTVQQTSDQALIQPSRQISARSNASTRNHPFAASQSAGLPLNNRSFFESRLGADFSTVRIHADSRSAHQAEQLGARAFTTGDHISFNQGEYNPFSYSGKKLIAHELVHTLQQGASQTSPQLQRFCGDERCDLLDPDTPNCPNPQDFLHDPALTAIRDSVFAGPGNLFIVERGDTGPGVALIQQLILNSDCEGYDRAGVRAELATQTFGEYTDQAVEQFQSTHSDANGNPLVVDGDVGPATLSAMDILLNLEPVEPAAGPEDLGQCYGEAEEGPGESRELGRAEILPIFPFFPAYKAWELSNFDIDESFVKTEHRQFIRGTILPALRDAEADFPDASDIHFRLVGEASTTAGYAHNLRLSAQRTHCIRATLVDEGIDGEDIRDHSAAAIGETLAQLRRAAAGLPVDNVEDRHARKVTVILDLTSEENNDESCDEADKTLASQAFRARVACAGSHAIYINIGNFGNPAQPVYREFLWTHFPLLEDCYFQLTSSPDEFIPLYVFSDFQLAQNNPDSASARSDFQGQAELVVNSASGSLNKQITDAVRAFSLTMRGGWNQTDCGDTFSSLNGSLQPLGPVRCGTVPAPTPADNCYPSPEECSDETRQEAAQEFVAIMIRFGGDPTEALKRIKGIAKYVEAINWIFDFFGVQALIGGGALVIGTQDLSTPLIRPFLFLGGGIGDPAAGPLDGNLLTSETFTLETPKQLEKSTLGLLLQDSDFEGSASIEVIGGTNRENLTINGDGFSKTVPLWGILCDGGATRTQHGHLMPITNAKCRSLIELPHLERECDEECPDDLKLSGFDQFTLKFGRASYSAIPGIAQRVADRVGGCGATMAFINVGNKTENEEETGVYRKFVFIGQNQNCMFTVDQGTRERSFTLDRHLAYGDPNDWSAFSDFAGIASVDAAALLTVWDIPTTEFLLPGTYAASCDNGKIQGVVIPISAVDCGEIPTPLHITTPDPADADRCNQFKDDNAPLVSRHVRKLNSDYQDILNSIDAGPALRYPLYNDLFYEVGNVIPNAVFVGKTVGNEPVISIMDIEVLHGTRLPNGYYVFKVNVLSEPCSFNSLGEPTLLLPENCREGFIKVGGATIFPIPHRTTPPEPDQEPEFANNREFDSPPNDPQAVGSMA